MWVIIVGVVGILFCLLMLYSPDGTYSYHFEEKTVRGRFLEQARQKLDDYHSPLIETDDPCII